MIQNQPGTPDFGTIALDCPISERDLLQLVSILGEISGMDGPILARKHALMNKLCPLLGSDRWIWTTSANFGEGKMPVGIAVAYGGFTEREFGLIIEASQDPEMGMPENDAIAQAMLDHGHVTCTRSDFLTDEQLHSHPHWELYRKPVGSDHYLFSLYPIGNGYLSGIGFHRLPGEPDFTARERRILHLLASQITWLHLADVPEHTEGTFAEVLTPRLRTVFTLLLQGWNRRKIAEHLGITLNTSAGYIKEVYRHFGVSSQVQLLSTFLKGDGGDTVTRTPAL